MDGLEHLAWAVCDGVFLPVNPPMLTGHHEFQWIIAGTMLRLIYQGATAGAHCPPCTIASHITEQAAKQQGTSWHTMRFKPQTTRSSPMLRTPTVRSVVNVSLRATSSLSTEGALATSLDDCEEDDGEEEAFHQFHWRRVQQSGMWKEATPPPCQVMCASPSKSHHIDLMWQTTKWLLDCGTSLKEEEISWWLLVNLLTNGSDAATKDLTKRLMATWKWVGVVLESPVCPSMPTVLNIRQFFDEDSIGHGWSQQKWLLAYACMLQYLGEATDGRMWRPNGKHFMPQISMLVDAFLEVTSAVVVKADVAHCWSEPPPTIPWQRDKGTFVNVISHLDNLAQHQPTRKAWDELVCLPPPTVPTPHTGVGTWAIIRDGWWSWGECCPPWSSASAS